MTDYNSIEKYMDLCDNVMYNQFDNETKVLLLKLIKEIDDDYMKNYDYFKDQIKNNTILCDIFFNTDNLIDFLNSFKEYPLIFIMYFLKYIGIYKQIEFLPKNRSVNDLNECLVYGIFYPEEQIVKIEFTNNDEFYIIKLTGITLLDLLKINYK